MPEPTMTESMQRRVREYCEAIAGHNGLEDDVRDELETYFQDKMLGYLSREEALTEEDAFILARKHFGDEQVVRDLLLNVHENRPIAAINKWFLAGAALAFAGCLYTRIFSLLPPGLASALMETWGTTPPLGFFLVFFALSTGFLLVAVALNWRVNRDSLDHLFGWYLVALVIGTLVLVPPWRLLSDVTPANVLKLLVHQAVTVVVAVGFFRRARWTKWAMLTLLILTLSFYYWRLGVGHLTPQAMGAASAITQPAPGIMHVPATLYVEIPPNWYAQSLYLLALIHCFSPRARYAKKSSVTSRAPVAG